jgi:hypothetical protein
MIDVVQGKDRLLREGRKKKRTVMMGVQKKKECEKKKEKANTTTVVMSCSRIIWELKLRQRNKKNYHCYV